MQLQAPGHAGFGADFPVWLPESFLGAHLFLIHVASQLTSYSHGRQTSLDKSRHFSLTRIQVAEGQPGSNTRDTSPPYGGRSEGPSQAAGDRGPGKATGQDQAQGTRTVL